MKKHIKNIKERIDKFGILKLLIILIAITIIFQAGIFVGYHKAGFYRSMGENYRPFDDKGRGFSDKGKKFMMQNSNIPGGHGAVGKIVSINLPTIVVASPDNIEKTVSISDDTLIRQFRETVSAKDLKVGEYAVVIGDNNVDGGVVKAKLIRLLPQPQDESISSTTTTNTSLK